MIIEWKQHKESFGNWNGLLETIGCVELELTNNCRQK